MTPQSTVGSSTLFLVLQDEDIPQHRHATDTIHLLVEYIYICNLIFYFIKKNVAMFSHAETCIFYHLNSKHVYKDLLYGTPVQFSKFILFKMSDHADK